MTICFVTPEFVTEESCFDGGLSNYLFRVSLGLIELGHVPIIVVSSTVNEIITYQDIEVHRVNVYQLQGSTSINWMFHSYILNNYLEKIVSKKKIDIVQYASYTGVGFYRIKNLPVVVRVSSYNPLLAFYYNSLDIENNKNNSYIEISAIRKANAVFGPSKLIASEILEKENIKVSIIESPFIFNHINLDYSFSNQLSGKKYLLFFGTLSLLKGLKTIAEILEALFSKNKDIYFVFIGKDAGYNGGKMMDYIYQKASNFSDRIFYFDRMSHEKLYPFIKNAQAVILPSRIDNFPNACIEALAHGKIVVGTRNTGFDQLIEDGRNGYLCERDNGEELLQLIEKILALDESEVEKIQNNAKKGIEILKPCYVIEQLAQFYQNVIDQFKQNSTLPNIDSGIENSIIWDHIADIENKLTEQAKVTDNQKQLTNNVLNSKSYIIGNYIIQPLSFLKNSIKWPK